MGFDKRFLRDRGRLAPGLHSGAGDPNQLKRRLKLEELLTAIYNALSGDDDLTELVPANQIRRGWNEPVVFPEHFDEAGAVNDA